ncbi:isocitrate lyase/phosphoenolpyruvate mutase family protein [Streptomyces sp. 3MP-14]|uniref:Isocitrate lyase/phosphoenolpyruvate mutase family protein n=1 Tax=Streptomyces mimosae TaxID=2586635 RepID=A0A5N6AI83_9ACTN|nr:MULTISPECIES: isocitrate lyase/phosphoenolpyruvate mutase family protein [Streptomyces]KAB8167862.1 isocitrate lyase/phosphoenolpyruvate mutase family protein [Streptomyces mimosae]KAB8177490.1 isocitrate lyase/phosphoenolpyruvate mutase family protein [Streptomyces sp. 3MP-14]
MNEPHPHAPHPTDLATRARLLHTLHRGARPLLLANAWDALSARLAARAGAAAIATTSSGVAWSLGAPDGDRLARADAVALVARVASAVELPVTADIESGFAPDAAGVGETVAEVLAAGAVGVNLEDSSHGGPQPLRPAGEQAERLAAARAAAEAAAVPLFLNARVDVFLRHRGAATALVDEALARGRAYLAAGADGVFVPGVTDPELVRTLADGLDAPLNVLAGPGAPDVAALTAAGAARISLGSAIAQAAYGLAARATEEFLAAGTYGALTGALDYGGLNSLMSEAVAPGGSGDAAV